MQLAASKLPWDLIANLGSDNCARLVTHSRPGTRDVWTSVGCWLLATRSPDFKSGGPFCLPVIGGECIARPVAALFKWFQIPRCRFLIVFSGMSKMLWFSFLSFSAPTARPLPAVHQGRKSVQGNLFSLLSTSTKLCQKLRDWRYLLSQFNFIQHPKLSRFDPGDPIHWATLGRQGSSCHRLALCAPRFFCSSSTMH